MEERGEEERFDVFEDFLFSAIPEEKRELIMDILEADPVSILEIERNHFRARLHLHPKPSFRSFQLRVDHSLSLEERISLGGYSVVNESIFRICEAPRFNHCDEGEVNLLHLGEGMDSGGVMGIVRELGFRPLSYVELLAFAIQYPEVVRSLQIVALEPVWDLIEGHRRAAQTMIVSGKEKGVMLGLPPFDGHSWHSEDHYLVRRSRIA